VALRKILSYVLILAVSIVSGVTVGKVFLDMNAIPVSSLVGSEAEFRESDKVVEELVERSRQAGVAPDSFNGIELFQIAEYNLNNSENFLKEMVGQVNSTGQVVYMRSQKVKVGNEFAYYKLSPSKAVLGITTPQICSKVSCNIKNLNNIKIVTNEKGVITNTSSSETLDGDFSATPDIYNEKSYFDIFKTVPYTTMSFIVSEKTTSGCVSEVVANGDGTYSFEIKYTPKDGVIDAAYLYAHEIEFSSGYSLPYWDSVKLKITVDSNFYFKTIEYDERYMVSSEKIPVLGKADVVDTFVDHYYYDIDSIAEKVLPDFRKTMEV